MIGLLIGVYILDIDDVELIRLIRIIYVDLRVIVVAVLINTAF